VTRTLLFWCSLGSTSGWLSSSLTFLMLGKANIGTLAAALVPLCFWLAWALVSLAQERDA